MRDEEYVYYQDVREKKVTGYSARKQRSHCGKSGRVRLPSDYLSKKELQNMSGECKSYRLNEPMKWPEFKAMPTDIQGLYLTALREKYNVSDAQLAKMFGAAQPTVSAYLRKNGMNRSGSFSGKEAWDKEGFLAWVSGVPKTEECQSAQETVEEESLAEETPAEFEQEVVEEETAVAEECPIKEIPNPGIKVNLIDASKAPSPAFAIPATGSMTYEGDALDILRSISRLLGGAKVLLSVKWDVVEE